MPGTASAPASTTVASQSVDDIAEAFRQAINSRDDDRVTALAPGTPEGTREFLIGGGPYDTVDCYQFNGREECRVINGIADFTFVVDVMTASVVDVTYVGGE